MIRDDDSHWGGSKASMEIASQRTTNTMRGGSISSRIIHMRRPFPQMTGIPAKSMDLTCLVYRLVGSQRGL